VVLVGWDVLMLELMGEKVEVTTGGCLPSYTPLD